MQCQKCYYATTTKSEYVTVLDLSCDAIILTIAPSCYHYYYYDNDNGFQHGAGFCDGFSNGSSVVTGGLKEISPTKTMGNFPWLWL